MVREGGVIGHLRTEPYAIRASHGSPREHTLTPPSDIRASVVNTGAAMKTSLDHLPEHKREQVAAISALLQAEAQAEMVILFGSHARGD